MVLGCKELQANMANDTANGWHSMMFNTLDCADVLARSAHMNIP
jgi:hypothetical protein